MAMQTPRCPTQAVTSELPLLGAINSLGPKSASTKLPVSLFLPFTCLCSILLEEHLQFSFRFSADMSHAW